MKKGITARYFYSLNYFVKRFIQITIHQSFKKFPEDGKACGLFSFWESYRTTPLIWNNFLHLICVWLWIRTKRNGLFSFYISNLKKLKFMQVMIYKLWFHLMLHLYSIMACMAKMWIVTMIAISRTETHLHRMSHSLCNRWYRYSDRNHPRRYILHAGRRSSTSSSRTRRCRDTTHVRPS